MSIRRSKKQGPGSRGQGPEKPRTDAKSPKGGRPPYGLGRPSAAADSDDRSARKIALRARKMEDKGKSLSQMNADSEASCEDKSEERCSQSAQPL